MGGLFGVDSINFSSMDVKISFIHIHRAETFLVHKMVFQWNPSLRPARQYGHLVIHVF